MIRNFFLSCFAFVLLCAGANAQTTNTTKKGGSTTNTTFSASDATFKKEIETMGMAVVKSYFDKDCNYLYNALDNTIKSFENGQVFQKNAALQTELCNSNPLRTDMTVTYAMYQQNYKIAVLSAAEFRQKYAAIADQIQMQSGDYFFDGSQLAAKTNTSVFRANDMARFVARKVNGAWKIISM